MNASDRAALEAISAQLAKLVEQSTSSAELQAIIPQLKEVAEMAPTLKEITENWKRAGWAGRVVGKVVKWIGIAAGAIAGSWSVWTFFLGAKS